ncbi:MAG: 7-carboxy-7-deazaguanine synthase QueE [Chloroherpetonaceae bacterium]|nr:7-carboxy-7-deazaguanine synthase QueE [Chloroherpetonaceae bacterium]MDW8438672.1 7-carboxy-7-deazaguanine synthase QueE [Chloroherpetonaceae bacterium]
MKPMLKVNEIFFSIQGESTRMGLPCVFVRLTECNLRCTYCDTEYAFYEGEERSLDSIIEEVRSYDCDLVEITGGEPLLQEPVYELMTRLCDLGYEVLLETSGSILCDKVDRRVRKIIDMKTPSSGMLKRNDYRNLELLAPTDEVKFVIGSRLDYDWSKTVIAEHRLTEKCVVLMSVVFGELHPQTLAEWILADRLRVRFQLQMHKYIWAPETRGV